MRRWWLLVLPIMATSCATPEKGLFQADSRAYRNPRAALAQSIQDADLGRFVYFDRKRNIVYSLGNKFAGFDFERVDMVQLRNESPEVFDIVQCASGRECSIANYDACKASVRLNSQATEVLQDRVVKTLKSRGYPLIRVNFLNDENATWRMEVQYFTECDFITQDIESNFPHLMGR